MELGLGHMGMTPDQFWSLTMPEFRAKLDGFKEFHGIKPKDATPSVAAIHDMMQHFPDGPISKERRLQIKRSKKRRYDKAA
jgi:uncharacterized phage protein (TIGR02216 family)